MEFVRGGEAIRRTRRERKLTQEQLAEMTNLTSNTVSRIERGALVPALPTLIDICNVLGVGADSILAAYISADTPIRWTTIAHKMAELEAEKQNKIETILDCLIKTI